MIGFAHICFQLNNLRKCDISQSLSETFDKKRNFYQKYLPKIPLIMKQNMLTLPYQRMLKN